VNLEDVESAQPQVAGFVVREASTVVSSWRASGELDRYLDEHAIVGISEIDTRALTRHLRTHGAKRGIVSTTDHDHASLVARALASRSMIGLVPQELTTDAFESVWNTVSFSRGLFGRPANPAHIEKVLRDLSLWNRKDSKVMTLSGGMKRRLLIAKALSHEPRILFLDEPTAGVDVELRQEMWKLVRALKASGKAVYVVLHVNHARELSPAVRAAWGSRLVAVMPGMVLVSRTKMSRPRNIMSVRL